MAGVSGKLATLKIGKQTAKGTPAASATYGLKFVGGNLEPRRQMIALAESDSTLQQGKSLVVSEHVEGSTEHYVRPDDFGLLAYLFAGANASSGTTNYTHTATIAASQLYATAWKNLGSGALIDKYSDLRLAGLHVRGQAGGALTCTCDWMGLVAAFGATDDPIAVVSQDPLVYPQVTVTKAGSAPGTVESFEIDLVRNTQMIQADKQLAPYDTVTGEVQVSGSITMLFESDSDYRKFHTAAAAGTAVSQTMFAEALNIKAEVNTNLSVAFDFASVAYQEYPVGPNPGGDAIRVVLGFRSQPAAAVADYLEIITKNAVASY